MLQKKMPQGDNKNSEHNIIQWRIKAFTSAEQGGLLSVSGLTPAFNLIEPLIWKYIC